MARTPNPRHSVDLKKEMKKANVTPEFLAENVGVAPTTVARWMAGQGCCCQPMAEEITRILGLGAKDPKALAIPKKQASRETVKIVHAAGAKITAIVDRHRREIADVLREATHEVAVANRVEPRSGMPKI